MANRYHGWKFGDSETDQKVLAVFLEFQERGEDFSAYLKQLVITDRYEDDRAPDKQIMDKLEEIRRLISGGATMPRSDNEDDDQGLADLLNRMPT